MITLFLLVLAAVLFFLATINAPAPPRINTVAAGLLCLTLAYLLSAWPHLAH